MSTALYELANMREALDSVIAENEGELDAALEAALDKIDGAFEEKAERVALYIRERLALAKAIKDEEERLEARRNALTNAAKSLTTYLEVQMRRVGKQKVNGLLCTVAFQKNPASVVETVPTTQDDFGGIWTNFGPAPQFIRVVPESFSWDRNAIKDAHKAGTLPEEIAKRVAVVQTESLRIR